MLIMLLLVAMLYCLDRDYDLTAFFLFLLLLGQL